MTDTDITTNTECTALTIPNEILDLPPKRLIITHPKSDVVKQGFAPAHFMAEGISPDVMYWSEMEVSILLFKGPGYLVKNDITKLGPRSYFPGKFVDGGKPVCKSEDGVHPVPPYAAEPQLQMMATTCQECALSKWDNATKTPPQCREKVRLYLAHVESGMRFVLDIKAGTKAFYRVKEMYQTLTSTVTFENAIAKCNKPSFSYSTLMSLRMGDDGWPMLSFSKIKPLQDWQRFIPLYEDLVKPKAEPVEDVIENSIEEVLEVGI